MRHPITFRRPESGALGLRSVVLANPEGEQVLVKIHSASICGTDLHIFKWNDWSARVYRPPFRLGHEFGGTVRGWTKRQGDQARRSCHR